MSGAKAQKRWVSSSDQLRTMWLRLRALTYPLPVAPAQSSIWSRLQSRSTFRAGGNRGDDHLNRLVCTPLQHAAVDFPYSIGLPL